MVSRPPRTVPLSGPDRRQEAYWRRRGFSVIAGVDEAGRGCLAGPVVAAAVILPARAPAGVQDSKRLSAPARERLYHALVAGGAQIGIGQASPEEIDAINIRQASFLAMRRAIALLAPVPDALLVDGFVIPECGLPQRALIKGDARCLSIAAASIVAKVYRDRLMVSLARDYPPYGFERHKGYPTRAHVGALRDAGPSRIHRRTFGPVAALLGGAGGIPTAGGAESATERA
jgi:ribonuclease HII